MSVEIKANFKQATVKGGTAVIQMEVLTAAKGFYDLMRLAGQNVFMTLESDQPELDFEQVDEVEAEPLPISEDAGFEVVDAFKPANVDAETGEVYPPIEDEAFMLPNGGEEQ